MAHTYSVDHASTTTESVTIGVAPKSELTKGVPSVSNSGANLMTYKIGSGDPAYPATVVYSVEDQVRKGNPARRATMTLNTWASDYNDVTGLTEKRPISVQIAFVVPGDLTLELADLSQLLGDAFSFTYASVSAGVRDTGYLKNLQFGVPAVV